MTVHKYQYKVVPKQTDPGKVNMVVGDSFEGKFLMPDPPLRGNVTAVESGTTCKRRIWIADSDGKVVDNKIKVGTQPVLNIGTNQGELNLGPGEWTVHMDTRDENGNCYYAEGQEANSSTKLTLMPYN